MLEIHAIRREDLLTAFSLSAVLRLRRRFHVSAGRYRQQRGNTRCEAANRRNEKKALSAATSFFPFRLPLRGLKGASSPFLVGPARRNRWWFSGSLLTSKENISLNEKALYPRATGAQACLTARHTLHTPPSSQSPAGYRNVPARGCTGRLASSLRRRRHSPSRR